MRTVTLVDPQFVMVDDNQSVLGAPRADTMTDLGALVSAVAARHKGPGVVALTAAAANHFGLPDALPSTPAPHKALGDLQAAGWSVPKALYPWMLLRHDQLPPITLGILPWADQDPPGPTVGANWSDAVDALAHWHQLTGLPWSGSPGTTAIAMLREMYPRGARDGGIEWVLPGSAHATAWRMSERPYQADGDDAWRYHQKTPHGVHRLDARRAYLAAWSGAQLAKGRLQFFRTDRFDPKLSGFWLVKPEPWTNKRMPDPCGYPWSVDDGWRWVTTPTLVLLSELAARADDDPLRHAGFTIRESWIATGTQGLLRPFAERIRDILYTRPRIDGRPGPAVTTAHQHNGAEVTANMHHTAKGVYAEGWGMLCRVAGPKGSRLWRPDWHATIAGHARAVGWRKAAVAATRAPGYAPRYPVQVNVDEWTYARRADGAWPRGYTAADDVGVMGTFRDLELIDQAAAA